jgi:exopolysaccharide biosynthesis polyprenyl glycosylphosphotransferase
MAVEAGMTPAEVIAADQGLSAREGAADRFSAAALLAKVLHAGGSDRLTRKAGRALPAVGTSPLPYADVLAALVALTLSGAAATRDTGVAGVLLAAVIVLISRLLGAYDRHNLLVRKSTLEDAPILFRVATLYALVVWVLKGWVVGEAAGHWQLLALWTELFVFLLFFRSTARVLCRSLTPPERCLVISDHETCDWLRTKLAGRPSLHATVVAGIHPGAAEQHHTGFAFQDPDELRAVVDQLKVDRVIVRPGTGAENEEDVASFLSAARDVGVKVSLLPRLLEVVGSSVEFDDVDGLPFLSLRPTRLSRQASLLKRALDIVVSFTALLLFGPLFGIVSLLIRLDSSGPTFFRQRRVGRSGSPFHMLKFRTMVVGADAQKCRLRHLNEADGLFKIADDPRITRIGRLLRRTSLDELPQLINVLRGEMSLVGPRPLVEEEDIRIEGWRRRRLQLTPGMTGHWQILGSARIPMKEMIRIDYLYVTDWSLWLDIKILLRTIPYVLRARGM